MILRDARIEDCETVARGICMALHKETYGEMLKGIARICEREDVLYSYKHTIIAWEDDTPVGICLCYDGALYHEMRKTTFPLFDELKHDDADHQETAGEQDNPEQGRKGSMDLDNMQEEAEAGEYYMDSLAVWPEWRGRGIGMKLMQAQIERARELGFNKATLLVDPDNENAKHMYRKLGFVDDTEVYAFGQMFWKWIRKI